jgi:two-component system sensor histidine kinase KdpD
MLGLDSAYPWTMGIARSRRLEVRGPRVGLGYGVGVAGTAVAAGALLPFRGQLATTNVVLVFLLVVIAAAASGGLGPALTAAALGFLASDVLFTPPYYRLVVTKQQDWLSLLVYLVVALVVSALVGASEQRRLRAEQRERETHTLYELSASLVSHGRLDATLGAAMRALRDLLGLAGCAIVLREAEPEGDGDGAAPARSRVAASGGSLPEADELEAAADTALSPGGRAPAPDPEVPLAPGELLAVPMRAAGQPVGALVVVAGPGAGNGGGGGSGLGTAERRVLESFAGQAALTVEQARMDEAWARARALEATDRLRRALLNSVSHDLRTPIASILASASSLLDPDVPLDEQERDQFLATIEEEGKRLARLVHNLLDMSRIEAGAVDPHLAEVWLPDVVNPAVQRQRQTPSEQIIAVEVPESLPPVLVDPVRLEQVLANLLDNARRYGGNGLVKVSGRAKADAVELRVTDHGPGIPAGERERIFTQFYRLQPGPPRPAPTGIGAGAGTGMGLAICRGLVEAMGGRIWAETAPGGGAAFVARLPRADRPRTTPPTPNNPSAEGGPPASNLSETAAALPRLSTGMGPGAGRG